MHTKTQAIAIKTELLSECHRTVDSRITTFQNAIEDSAKAAREESKSSAGDKYETSRAMMHLEIEKNTAQLSQVMKSKKTLSSLSSTIVVNAIELGACVFTNLNNYYLAIGAGQITIQGIDYQVISPVSPIGQLLIGLKAGDSFSFRDKAYVILEVI